MELTKGIAPNGARTLRTGLLALLLGTRTLRATKGIAQPFGSKGPWGVLLTPTQEAGFFDVSSGFWWRTDRKIFLSTNPKTVLHQLVMSFLHSVVFFMHCPLTMALVPQNVQVREDMLTYKALLKAQFASQRRCSHRPLHFAPAG